jgi:hypothetical protein
MRRTNWKTVSTLVTMALLSGCMDYSVSAPDLASVAPAPMMLAPQLMAQLSLNVGNANNDFVDVTIGPKGGTIRAANIAVVISANAICDPSTTTYPGTSDSPCEALRTPITFHVEVRQQGGRTWVDFHDKVRFKSNGAHIYFSTRGAIGATDLKQFTILHATSIGGETTDESARDARLRTYVDTQSGIVWSRIDSFSGYTSSSGFICRPQVDEGC